MFTPQIVKAPTSHDVAQAAGVSRATVSFVLNDKPNARISADTRNRVLEAAQRLGYTPNTTARSLATNTVSGWLLAAPRVAVGDAVTRAIASVTDDVTADGTDVVLDANPFSYGADAAAGWARHRPECVLAGADRCTDAATQVLRLAGVRALLVYGPHTVDYAPALELVQADYGWLGATHLLGLGHRRLAYLAPADESYDEITADRERGARAAIGGSEGTMEIVRTAPRSDVLRDWAHGWRYRQNPPTGILAHDDSYAAAAVRALADVGVRCPHDVSVLGAEDQYVGAEYTPRLSSLTFDASHLAADITDAFSRMLAGEHVERVRRPELHVVERESVRSLDR